MRYYKIDISGGTSGLSGSATGSWTSLVGGQNDPAALDIEFDIQASQTQTAAGQLKIRGIDPKLISQSTNFNNQTISIYGGFTNGLPLANLQVPHQGLLATGNIFPCWGNWILNELSLDMYFSVFSMGNKGVGGPTSIKNIVHNMPSGTPLSQAIQNALSSAFPGANIVMNISSKLKLNYNDYGFYQGIEQYANYVKSLSHSILGTPPNYRGVSITTNGNNIHVDDGQQQKSPIAILATDLVGQPTWIRDRTIQVTTCLRGDIPFPDNTIITLPQTLINQTAQGAVVASDPSSNLLSGTNQLAFTGQWQVTGIRHIGKFRSTQADAWVTIIDAAAIDNGTNPNATNSPPTGAPNQSGQQTFNPPSGGAAGSTGGIGMA